MGRRLSEELFLHPVFGPVIFNSGVVVSFGQIVRHGGYRRAPEMELRGAVSGKGTTLNFSREPSRSNEVKLREVRRVTLCIPRQKRRSEHHGMCTDKEVRKNIVLWSALAPVICVGFACYKSCCTRNL